MTVHSFFNKSNIRRTLGGGGSQLVVMPAISEDFDTENLVANDLDEVNEGYFVVTPPLPQSVLDAGSEGTLISKMKAQMKVFVNSLKFSDAPNIIAGVVDTPQAVELRAVSGNMNLITFDNSAVDASVLSGNATIAEANPIQFVNGLAIINVTPTAPGEIVLALGNGPAGVDINSQLRIQV